MAFNNEIEKTEGEIKVLQAKLELLKQMEKHKPPCEKAFKRVYGYYQEVCERSIWIAFKKGYDASKEDCKVEEEPKPTPETLYQMFYDEKWSKRVCDDICKVVEEWMSQYTCETNKWDEDYKCGFLDCLDVLRKNLK